MPRRTPHGARRGTFGSMEESSDHAPANRYGRCPNCRARLDLDEVACPHCGNGSGPGLRELSGRGSGCLPLTLAILAGEVLAAAVLAVLCRG